MRLSRLMILGCCASALSGGTAWALPRAAASASVPQARPLVGPPPAWALTADLPRAPTGAAGAATVNLLADSQFRVTDGGFSAFTNSIYRIATAQGLDDGAVQVSWDPDLETITFHHIRILRDGKAIDMLGDGSTLTVARRERDLDRAMLDGELTAILQPEDLRVGDVIDYAYTRTRRDPAMGGHAEFLPGPADGTSYGRDRIRLLWPTSRKMNWRARPGVVQPVVRKIGDETELLSDLVDVTTKEPPQGAPSRFGVVNSVEVSDFASWADVARTIEPLYTKAATLAPDSPLKAEVARIAAASADPTVRAEKALALVQDQVRYLLLAMNDGGFVPATADQTWARRYGDCKAKTVLLIALLNELGIGARPVLVHTSSGDFVSGRLPALQSFDHVLVEARIGGRSYWLDGTRLGDRSLALLMTPNYRVGLPVIAAGAKLIPLTSEPLTAPTEALSLAIDASAGIDAPAPFTGQIRYHGDLATSTRLDYTLLSETDRNDKMRKFWRKNYDFVAPATVSMRDDAATGDFIIAMTGTAKMGWTAEVGTRWYEVDGARVGWKFDVNRDGQLNPDAPFAFEYPDWWTKRETIKLPQGGKGFALQGGAVDETVGDLYTFHRRVSIDGDVMTMETSTRSLAAELPAAKAQATRSKMAALSEVAVFVRAPDNYIPTDQDIAALKDDKIAQAKALTMRGADQFDKGDVAASLINIDAALALDPSLSAAHAVRAMILATRKDPTANAVADRALALNDKSWLAWNAKGIAAANAKHYEESEADFTKSIAIEGKYAQAYAGRTTARMLLGKFPEALADLDAALAIDPKLPLLSARAIILAGAERYDEALALTDKLLKQNPKDSVTRAIRAELLAHFDRNDAARADYDLLIAEKASVGLYLLRAALADGAKARADVDAAVKLDPRSTKALAARSSAAIERGAFEDAERDIAAIERIEPGSRSAGALRMESLIKRGKGSEALKVADALVAKFADATALNERCWTKATLNLSADTALADCEKALVLAPGSPAILDSRAFAKLRGGRIDDAIADYDAALKAAPKLAASLFGRGVARARKGDRASALADLAKARRISPKIDARFATYGVTVPEGYTAQ